MDEIKKENFDLKLRVSLLQERLSRSTPENIEGSLSEVHLNINDEDSLSLLILPLECRVESQE